MKKISLVMALWILFLTVGCSAFKPSTQTLSITCSDPDAVLLVDGQAYPLPAQIPVARNRDHSIQCYKEGHYPYNHTIGHHFSGSGVADLIGLCCILVPGFGLLTPGAWDLDQTDIFITLVDDE